MAVDYLEYQMNLFDEATAGIEVTDSILKNILLQLKIDLRVLLKKL